MKGGIAAAGAAVRVYSRLRNFSVARPGNAHVWLASNSAREEAHPEETMSVLPTSLLRLALAPSLASVTSRHLGLPAPDLPARQVLDRIPRTVVVGFEHALESRSEEDIADRIGLLDPALQGFGYEGAAMATTILDATAGGDRTKRLIEGPARSHYLVTYIGVGFALARLPRQLWLRALPDLQIGPTHPTLSWLAVDGYGFDLAYFQRHRWVGTGRRPRPWPFMGTPGYFQRAADQGIGRALWFIGGARPDHCAATIATFSTDRRADLWSGVGLAAAFAGPAGADVAALPGLAGTFAADVRVGVALAARARWEADLVPPHTEKAALVLTGRSAADLARVVDECAVEEANGQVPAYELWRSRVRVALSSDAAMCEPFMAPLL